jgi:hypothetical protein
MAVAIIYPESGSKGGRGKTDAAQNSLATGQFGSERLRIARAVLAYSRETGGKLHREVMREPANGGLGSARR